jgi:hypothetical protein
MLNYVVRHENLLQCEDVCNSLATTWKGLKYGVGKDIYVVHNVVEVAIISTSSSIGLRVVGSCVGLNRRALRRAFHRRQFLDAKEEGEQWAKGDRRVLKYALAMDVEAFASKWCFEETRVSPNKKDVLHHRMGIEIWETNVTYFLKEGEASWFSNFERILFVFWTINFVLCNVYITFNVQF